MKNLLQVWLRWLGWCNEGIRPSYKLCKQNRLMRCESRCAFKKLINVSLYLLSCIPTCLRKRNLGKLDNSVLPDRVRVYDGGDNESADKKTMKTTRKNFDSLQFNCITFVLLNKVNSIVIIFKCNRDRIVGDKG